LVVSAASDEL